MELRQRLRCREWKAENEHAGTRAGGCKGISLMKIELKKLFAGKKRILAVVIGVVCICALAGGIFFVNQSRMERKKVEEQKIVKEKEEKAEKRKKEQEAEKKEEEKNAEKAEARPKEKKGPWTDYAAFIEDVKKGVEDDFRNISAEEVDISHLFESKEADTETHVWGYYLEDLDSDGVDELFFGLKDKWVGYTTILDIYTMKDGYVSHVASAGDDFDDYLCLYENGTIGYRNFASEKDVYQAYYTWKDGGLQFIEALIHKGGEKFFYSKEGITTENAIAVSWEQISKELQEKGYEKKEIVLTPFIEIADTSDFADNEKLTYEDLEGKEFWFYSGAGGWGTSLKIHGDGSFIGNYEDSDADSVSKCDFSGRFTNLRKTGPYEYTMKCTDLKFERKPGTEERVKGRMVYYSDPYGFDDAEEFKVYLPGKKVNELADGFLSWSHEEAASDYLQCYGIYNVGGRQGFVEMKDMKDFEAEE